MKEETSIEVFDQVKDKIDKVTHSTFDYGIKNVRVTFKNGYGISISKGAMIYCDEGTVEIAPITKDGDLFPMPGAIGIENNRVKGYVNKDELLSIMKTIANFNS